MTLRTRLSAVFAMAFSAVLMALPALAEPTEPPPPTLTDNVNSKVAGGVTDAASIVTTNIPLILGVVVLFVLLHYGLRLIRALAP